jgi:copper(I)-binding protein
MKATMRKSVLATVLALAVAPAWAADVKLGPLEIKQPWARATAAGQPNGAGYLEVDNTGSTPDRLVGVRSDAAERMELHTMVMEGGTAQMRQVEGGIEVPAGGKAVLAPGGFHVMFIKLKAPFTAGGSVPIVLEFEKAGEVPVTLDVRSFSGQPGMGQGMGHGMGSMDHGAMPGMKSN